MPSESYLKQEEKNAAAALEKGAQEAAAATVVYWAPAKGYQLANFITEKKGDGGAIIRPEMPLRFSNHVVSTDDQKKIAFIEASGAFGAGIIRKCKNMDEALRLTAEQGVLKRAQVNVKCEDVTEVPKGERK